MQFSIDNIKTLVAMAYVAHAKISFGADGETALVLLLDRLKELYRRCPPESLRGTLTVIRCMTASPNNPRIKEFGAVLAKSTELDVAQFLLGAAKDTHCIVEITANGQFAVLSRQIDIDLKGVAKDSLVYRFDRGVESIFAGNHEDVLLKVSPLLLSNFAVPTLNNLEEAMRYYESFATETKCPILAEIWEGGVDGPRLVLVNKPESYMRDSLVHALQLVLRDTSVRPEQNTDETKPVDIRVEWFASGASALIEIKWLGRSTAKPKSVSKSKKSSAITYTNYSAGRAQEGADQLADYMDREVRHSNASAPKGYLVVFDARRKAVGGAADPLTASDAMHFATKEISLNPDHSQSRTDFAPAVRYFLNPRKSFLASV